MSTNTKISQLPILSGNSIDNTTYIPVITGTVPENRRVKATEITDISIDKLTDVNISGITDGQILIWNESNSEFEPYSIPSSDGISIVRDYGLSNKIVIIDVIEPNTLYIYDSVVSSLTISGRSDYWNDSSMSHIKFTSDSVITITYSNDVFLKFNSDTTAQPSKQHEINLFGDDAILIVKN